VSGREIPYFKVGFSLRKKKAADNCVIIGLNPTHIKQASPKATRKSFSVPVRAFHSLGQHLDAGKKQKAPSPDSPH